MVKFQGGHRGTVYLFVYADTQAHTLEYLEKLWHANHGVPVQASLWNT